MFEDPILWSGSSQYLLDMYLCIYLNIGKDETFLEIPNIYWRSNERSWWSKEKDVGIELPGNLGMDILVPNTK